MDKNQVALVFPFTYVSPDNHPDDGLVAKQVLEKIFGRKLVMRELDYDKHFCHSWEFDLSERRYFIIAYFDPDTNKWAQEFGDYSKTCCKEELSELRYNADSGQKMRYRMFETTNAQPTINALLTKLGETPAKEVGQPTIYKGVKGTLTTITDTHVNIKLKYPITNKSNLLVKAADLRWDHPSQVWRVSYLATKYA